MSELSKEEQIKRISEFAELMGLSPEALLATMAQGAAGVQRAAAPAMRRGPRPAPIVYPNIEYPPYGDANGNPIEYPKMLYQGMVKDVEEPFVKIIDGQQVNAIKVLRDQFVPQFLEVEDQLQEAVALREGWLPTYVDAKKAAIARAHAKGAVVDRGEGVGVEIKEIPAEPVPRHPGPKSRRAA